jgi:hypothetical protein
MSLIERKTISFTGFPGCGFEKYLKKDYRLLLYLHTKSLCKAFIKSIYHVFSYVYFYSILYFVVSVPNKIKLLHSLLEKKIFSFEFVNYPHLVSIILYQTKL